MKYTFPDTQNSSITYKGRRFWIIEIAEGDEFDLISKSDADYAFYDAKYEALYGCGFYAKISKTGSDGFWVTPTTTHVDLSYSVETLTEAVKTLPAGLEYYLETCGG